MHVVPFDFEVEIVRIRSFGISPWRDDLLNAFVGNRGRNRDRLRKEMEVAHGFPSIKVGLLARVLKDRQIAFNSSGVIEVNEVKEVIVITRSRSPSQYPPAFAG